MVRLSVLTYLVGIGVATADIASLFNGDVQVGHATFYEVVNSSPQCSLQDWETSWLLEHEGPITDDKVWPVAINSKQYQEGLPCGLCIAAVGGGDGTGVTPIPTDSIRYGVVVDECPDCQEGDVVWEGEGEGRWQLAWYPVQCPVGGTLLSYVAQGSDAWYLKIQVRNELVPVKSVRIKSSSNAVWTEMTKPNGDNFWIAANQGQGPWDIEATSMLGDVVTDAGIQFEKLGTKFPDQIVTGTVQFPVHNDVYIALQAGNPLPTAPGTDSVKPDDGDDDNGTSTLPNRQSSRPMEAVAIIVEELRPLDSKPVIRPGPPKPQLPEAMSVSADFTYMGCFKDQAKPRTMTGVQISLQQQLTPEMCNAKCAEAGFTYFGLQFYFECFCSDSYKLAEDDDGSSKDCILPCDGDKNLNCGGYFLNSVYRVRTSSDAKPQVVVPPGPVAEPPSDNSMVVPPSGTIEEAILLLAPAADKGEQHAKQTVSQPLKEEAAVATVADDLPAGPSMGEFDPAPAAPALSSFEHHESPESVAMINFDANEGVVNVNIHGCAKKWAKCGGKGWTGPTCCSDGAVCQVSNDYYSQCVPSSPTAPLISAPAPQPAPAMPVPEVARPSKAPAAVTATAGVSSCAVLWGQCGGQKWTGGTCCPTSTVCLEVNPYYSQCVPEASAHTNELASKSGVPEQRMSITNEFQYMGCYMDTPERVMTGASKAFKGVMTPQVCRDECAASGFKYFGLQYHWYCSCGDTYALQGDDGHSNECNTPCDGDPSAMCGGSYMNSVYAVLGVEAVTPTPAAPVVPGQTPAPTLSATSTTCAAVWQQCGGSRWAGPTCCDEGLTCTSKGVYYSQCRPLGSTPIVSVPMIDKAPTPTRTPVPTPVVVVPEPNTTGSVVTGSMPIPLWNWGTVQGVLGKAVPDDSSYSLRDGRSACGGGGLSTMSWQCPHMMLMSPDMVYAASADGNDWAVYGVVGTGSDSQCGQCFQLGTADKSRRWIVQAFNQGGDVSAGQFDIFMGAGGLGVFNSCSGDCKSGPGCGGTCQAPLFSGPHSVWAPKGSCFSGGVKDASACEGLTKESNFKDNLLVYGCEEAINEGFHDNFVVYWERVKCPTSLYKVTGLRRTDEASYPDPSPTLTLTKKGRTTTMQDCCKGSCAWKGKVTAEKAFPSSYSCDINGIPLNT